MAFQDMRAELRGSVAKLPFAYTGTLINRAWRTIREANLWSFNLVEHSWISPPPLIGIGTAKVQTGSPNVQFDPVAIAAINAFQAANPYVLVTQLQFRIAVGGIYSLIAYNSTLGSAILERPYSDPSFTATSFQLYQLYYIPVDPQNVPIPDFLGYISVRNPQMFMNLDLTKNRAWLDSTDPQRTWYQFPSKVVPFKTDTRGQGTPNPSGSLGCMLYELWGQPVSPFTYQCYGIRRGQDLVNPTDTLPIGVPEELVMYKAREYAYEWAEANKEQVPRSQLPDFRFLIAEVRTQYKDELTKYRKQDRELVDNYCMNVGFAYGTVAGIYNTLVGVASPYAPA